MANGTPRNGLDRKAIPEGAQKPRSLIRLRTVADGASSVPGGSVTPVEPTVPRPARLPATDGFHAAKGAPDVELIDDPWESEESGIAEVPPSAPPGHGSPDPRESQAAALVHALRAAHAELMQLEATASRLRVERDHAQACLATVRDEATRELVAMRQELIKARVDAQHARDAQRRAEQRAIGKLDQFQRQVADMEARVAAAQDLLALLR